MKMKKILLNPNTDKVTVKDTIRRDIECSFEFRADGEAKKLLHRLMKSYVVKIIIDGRSITTTLQGVNLLEKVADNQLLVFDYTEQVEVLLELDEIKKVVLLS